MRRAGVLIHPTSLPGPYGMGDIGPSARDLLAWLDAAGQTIWQMLPLGPVDGLGSPYSSPSAIARNPLLLSVDDLAEDGWLRQNEKPYVRGGNFHFDHDTVHRARWPALGLAAERVRDTVDLSSWATANPWVDPWALFAALADEQGTRDFTAWPTPLRDREPAALEAARDRLARAIGRQVALQWLFDGQWARLRAEATKRGIALWGDLPFLVAGDSCDVWAHRELFRVDRTGRPTVVAGVPPDAFTREGQRWGMPLYAVRAHKRERYAWWRARTRALTALFDAVRIDHFRGIQAVWEIPADEPTAVNGQWVEGFGRGLLDALREELGGLPLIAEDLGFITPDVEALRDRYELPGMAILQFGFVGRKDGLHAHLPHNHTPRLVVYPGTHDNDTTVGWYRTADAEVQDEVRRYLGTNGHDISGDFVRAAYRSVARTAIVSMQDILSLDSDARMNTPGRSEGNWSWRMPREAMNLVLARRLREQVGLTGRLPSLARAPEAVDSADPTEGDP